MLAYTLIECQAIPDFHLFQNVRGSLDEILSRRSQGIIRPPGFGQLLIDHLPLRVQPHNTNRHEDEKHMNGSVGNALALIDEQNAFIGWQRRPPLEADEMSPGAGGPFCARQHHVVRPRVADYTRFTHWGMTSVDPANTRL